MSYNRAWYERNRERVLSLRRGALNREYNLKKKYGLTVDELEQMKLEQMNLCAICHQTPTLRGLFVDHDHETGLVRGLLCQHCNLAIGHLKDDPEIALAVAEYLQRERKS
jgi:hypothetical protein